MCKVRDLRGAYAICQAYDNNITMIRCNCCKQVAIRLGIN